ncbi:MAG: hypothetical protein P8J75_00225 [Actinomycetota bacterium]|nr:hypothetical protein [Actinomycetota bacterium]
MSRSRGAKSIMGRVAQQAEAQYEPPHKPTEWMRDLLSEGQ